MSQAPAHQDRYRETGVDTLEADVGTKALIKRLTDAWPKGTGPGAVMMSNGYFANVVNFGAFGVALCTDGVGSKALIAHQLRRYDTIGIDCVAMNVNDLICVGAQPVSMVDYIAVAKADSWMLDELGKGLAEGARLGQVSISGGEISQVGDIIDGFDLVGMAIGKVALDRIIEGQDVEAGDVVIGLESSGIHSNGMTLARRALLKDHGFSLNDRIDELGCTLGEELLRPTFIYVAEVMEILAKVRKVKALVNITSDGFLNLARVRAEVGYVLDSLPEPHPIFGLIRRYGAVSEAEMHNVYNMGVGFCVVVSADDVDTVLGLLKGRSRNASRIGYVVEDREKRVRITQRGLVGRGKFFTPG